MPQRICYLSSLSLSLLLLPLCALNLNLSIVLNFSSSLSLKMSLPVQKNNLRLFVQSMYDEGIVNDQFCQLQAMKETIRPDYVVRSVASYAISTPALFSQLTYLVNQPQVDFRQVNFTANELYWKTNSIGAEHVKLACGQILQACENHNKEHCERALYWTKKEYSKLRGKFETLVMMERKIIDLENGY